MRRYAADLVNAVRAMTSLPPLVLDDCLNDIAQRAIEDVADGGGVHGYFSEHCGVGSLRGECECGWAQENYGASTQNGWKVALQGPLCGMMTEPKGWGHRGNIESPEWTRIGIGVLPWRGGEGLQWVHEFGR
jgi:uncharacterized protein YkwD